MSMKNLQWLSVLALAVVAVIAGCAPAQNALHLAPETSADSLVFVLTGPEGSGPAQAWVYGLSVVECGTERAMWTIATTGGSLPSHVTYGRPVPGFVVREGPEPLVPGCYDVFISGGKPLRFLVDTSRVVRLPER
jgi:hypothetical protein